MIYNPFHEKSLPFSNRQFVSLNKVSSNDRGGSVWVTVSGRCLGEDKRDKAHSVWVFSSSLLNTVSQYGLNVCCSSLVSLQTAGCFWALKRIQQPLNNIRYGDHSNRNEWERVLGRASPGRARVRSVPLPRGEDASHEDRERWLSHALQKPPSHLKLSLGKGPFKLGSCFATWRGGEQDVNFVHSLQSDGDMN